MHQTKTSILYINTNHIPPYLACGLARVLIGTTAMRQRIRLIDKLDSGHVDNVSDIPWLSTNEKVGVRGVAAESGRMAKYHRDNMTSNTMSFSHFVMNCACTPIL